MPIATPRTSVASRRSSAASAPTVRTPSRCRAASATGPTPQSARTGRGPSTSCSSSGATTRSPSGFASSEAIFASCLPDSGADRGRKARPGAYRGAERGAELLDVAGVAPASAGGLRNASSSDTGSTTGAASASTAITCSDTAEYRLPRGGSTTACGHSRRACPIGIAERAPNTRAW